MAWTQHIQVFHWRFPLPHSLPIHHINKGAAKSPYPTSSCIQALQKGNLTVGLCSIGRGASITWMLSLQATMRKWKGRKRMGWLSLSQLWSSQHINIVDSTTTTSTIYIDYRYGKIFMSASHSHDYRYPTKSIDLVSQ